jgi:predicted nucleic-acid-binding protein
MIALDTNIVVRLLVADDPQQTAAAVAAVRDQDLLLPLSVLLETEWVLRSCYRVPRAAIAASLRRLIDLDRLTVDRPQVARFALDRFEVGFDFADALHLASSEMAREFLTFDRALVHRAAAHSAGPTVRFCT